jgi:hypothetical protein
MVRARKNLPALGRAFEIPGREFAVLIHFKYILILSDGFLSPSWLASTVQMYRCFVKEFFSEVASTRCEKLITMPLAILWMGLAFPLIG